MNFDLVIVMPVYNEEACIATVLQAWRSMLKKLKIRYCMLILNDGSRDNTAEVLKQFYGSTDIQVIDKQNSGHGPTILMGYRKAVEMAPWVFQCDSDDEIKADNFPDLWSRRKNYDALFGIRSGREQTSERALISKGSRFIVSRFFGNGIFDVNTPYRLIKASVLKPVLHLIPDSTFAPNLFISGAINMAGVRIYQQPVSHCNRKTGTVSLIRFKLIRSVTHAAVQTLVFRITLLLKGKSLFTQMKTP